MTQSECDATVFVTMEGARVVCACGRWESHPAGAQSFESRQRAMARWYDHFVATARASQQRTFEVEA